MVSECVISIQDDLTSEILTFSFITIFLFWNISVSPLLLFLMADLILEVWTLSVSHKLLERCSAIPLGGVLFLYLQL